jgi:nitroreductase
MINTMLERTSCRSYAKRKIEVAKINKLKQIVNASPSAINAQPFSAIFITNEKTKQELLKFNFNQSHVVQAPLIVIFCAD